MIVRLPRFVVLLVSLAALSLPAAAANTPTPKSLLENPEHWGAFAVKEEGGLACYIAGQPVDTKPDNVNRGEVWLLVTHRPYRGVADEVSIYTGYPYKKGSSVQVDIDGHGFKMFTDDDTAWAHDHKTDVAMVGAMRAGLKMVVEGTSSRGTDTTDTYDLRGFTRAHTAIDKACNVK
ncbi:MAG TPA: invasion associated locus B family protein [Alphaproteobacteria bacterium]|nr:invasion associated locus B family protein [Alphaproteobacteria bacterium]